MANVIEYILQTRLLYKERFQAVGNFCSLQGRSKGLSKQRNERNGLKVVQLTKTRSDLNTAVLC